MSGDLFCPRITAIHGAARGGLFYFIKGDSLCGEAVGRSPEGVDYEVQMLRGRAQLFFHFLNRFAATRGASFSLRVHCVVEFTKHVGMVEMVDVDWSTIVSDLLALLQGV